MNSIVLAVIIFTAFNILIFLYLRWYVKRRTSNSVLLPEYRNEVNKLIADIDAATDRDSLLVEERIKKLKEILDDTDKRISLYVKELDKSRTGEALYSNLGRGIRAALETEAEQPAAAHNVPVYSQPLLSTIRPNIETRQAVKPQEKPAAVIQQAVPSAAAPLAAAPSAAAPLASQKSPTKRQIRASIDLLVSEGLSPEEIASRLDISAEAVGIAMNLNRKKN